MDSATVRERAGTLPQQPGVYLFRDAGTPEPADEQSAPSTATEHITLTDEPATGPVLYVGKAVDLRDRVRSYADPRSERIAGMVDRAQSIEIAVTETETQALLLEANLIKRHAPRYNVRLTDDKSYPLVQLTDHEAPRIEITRDPAPGATVYGPYTDRGELETVVKAIRDSFGLRGCSEHKYTGRDRPCLDYEMGLCAAPCTGEISMDAYADAVASAKRFFEGETGVLAHPLEDEMQTAAHNQAFERAATLRDRLETVRQFHGSAGAAVRDPGDDRLVDVLGVARRQTAETATTVARLHSENGKLVDRDTHSVVVPTNTNPTSAAVLTAFIKQYYAERSLPDVLLVPESLPDEGVTTWLDSAGVELRVPTAGREARLVDLAMENAHTTPTTENPGTALASALDLDLQSISRIEAFDVSHSSGDFVVGSNVVLVDGQPDRSGYRRKRLPDENDDYANMHRLVRWRADRALAGRDDRPAPDLLVIDGGKGQLTAAREALAGSGWDRPAIGLAKHPDGDRVITSTGTIAIPDSAMTLLGHVRDEAHRFAVQYHETLRDAVSTPLDEVSGVGEDLRNRLLGRFGSIAGIRAASIEELQTIDGVGPTLAKRIDRTL